MEVPIGRPVRFETEWSNKTRIVRALQHHFTQDRSGDSSNDDEYLESGPFGLDHVCGGFFIVY